MPLFLVAAHDRADAEAPARRAAARAAHLAAVGRLGGAMIMGGAMLDAAGVPIGSTMVVDLPDRAAVDAWIASDPYTEAGVWWRVEVSAFRLAVLAGTAV